LRTNASAAPGNVQTQIQIRQTAAPGFFSLSPGLSHMLVLVYLLTLAYFSLRFLWGLWRTLTLTQRAHMLDSDLALTTPALLAISPEISVPATMGLHSPTLLLPPGFVEVSRTDDLHALIAHESAHMRRRDFLKNLIYRFLSLPIAYHPLYAITQNRLAETREMICDSLAARELEGPQRYAQSLLRLASTLSGRKTPSILHAIGFLDANTFERRVMNLTRNLQSGRLRKLLITSACTLVALAACTSALALRINIAEPRQSTTQTTMQTTSYDNSMPIDRHATITNDKKDSTLAEMVLLSKIDPEYPAEAKDKKDILNGQVFLNVTVGKDGLVKNVSVSKSLRADYDQSAIEAVRQWKWKPLIKDGNPVEVQGAIVINFQTF
jgi:TonB family protein